MSHDHIYCSNNEDQKMRENITKNAEIVLINEEKIKRLKQEKVLLNEKRLALISEAVDNNNRVVENYIANFNAKISQAKSDSKSHLSANFDRTMGQLSELENEITNISNKTAKSSSNINAISQSFDSAMQSIVSSMTSSSQRVSAYVDEIDKQLEDLKTLNPQLLGYENDYKRLLYTRNNIAANYNAGVYDAALSDAQSSLIDSSTLLLNCVSANSYFNAEYNKIMDNLDDLKSEFLKYEDGKDLVLRINGKENNQSAFDINYLTDGKFKEFFNQFDNFYNIVADRKITVNDLDNIKANVEQYKKGLDSYISQAKQSLASVLAVKQLAVNVFNKLDDNDWDLVDSGYVDKNMLNPYLSVYEDCYGNRINIICQKDKNTQNTEYYAKAFSKDGSESNDEMLQSLIRNLVSGDGIKTKAVYDTSSCNNTKTADEFVEHIVKNKKDSKSNIYLYN